VIDTLVMGTTDLAGELPQNLTTLSDESIKRLEEGRMEDIETVDVPVQRLAQFLVEARFVGAVQSALEKIPDLEARAVGIAQDAMRLVSFQLSELEASDEANPEVLAAGLAPVVQHGIERLEVEIEALHEALNAATKTIDEQLKVVLDGTNPYDLTGTSSDLDQHIRRHHGERAAAGARSLALRASERLKETMVKLVYRKSAGLLMARELRDQTVASGKLVDRMVALIEGHMPRPEVVDNLPSYYRQLFYGQATINETFWVGRKHQMAEAKRAIGSFGRGSSGAVVVTGERGSGKTSLVQRITTHLLPRRPIHRVMAPRGGSTEPRELAEALCKAVGATGTPVEVLSRLPDDAVVILDDLELWWERSEDGMRAMNSIVEMVERFGDRILFVLAIGSHAFSFVNKFRALGDDALVVLDCGPVAAEALKSIIMLRHSSTGLKFELEGKDEEQLTDYRLARLFSSHFDYTQGHIGAALRSWVAHVRKVGGSTLQLDDPQGEPWELFDELRPAHKALLVQLVLHKTVSRERLERITREDPRTLMHDIDTLVRMGLLQQSAQHTLSINPFVHHGVTRRLRRRGLLS
jgi:hypothetical protein